MKSLLYGISWRWPLVLALVGASFVLPSMAEGEDGEKCVSKCGEGDKEDDKKVFHKA